MWVSNKKSSTLFLCLSNFKQPEKFESWFCRYEFQMQYGSIGWSVGATLGYAQSVPNKRVIACIGDGSFQVSKNLKAFLFSFGFFNRNPLKPIFLLIFRFFLVGLVYFEMFQCGNSYYIRSLALIKS